VQRQPASRRQHSAVVGNDVLGVSPAGDQRHNGIAHLDGDDILTQGLDTARNLKTKNLGYARGRWIQTLALQQIGAV